MSPAAPEFSIIIPAYNEERRLPETLERIAAYVRISRRETEILVVDDGSTDRTAAIAESYRDKFPAFQVLSNGMNRGKGYSVRRGILEARGCTGLFTDADLSAPIEEADKLFAALEAYDAALGSRPLAPAIIPVHHSPFPPFPTLTFNPHLS